MGLAELTSISCRRWTRATACVVLTVLCCRAVCRETWLVMEDTNALGASDSFRVPDVDTCRSECSRVPDCVAVDVNVDVSPPLCWPHRRPADLRDDNIFSQPGTNLHQLTRSCADSKLR